MSDLKAADAAQSVAELQSQGEPQTAAEPPTAAAPPSAAAPPTAAAPQGAGEPEAIEPGLYRRMLESSPEGVALSDAQAEDWPVCYVNPAFVSLTGYRTADVLGKNLRILQREDRDQDGRHRLRETLKQGDSCRVLMRNYRKDGSVFWNEMTVLPLKDAQGRVTHFAAHYRDAGDRLRIDPKLSRDSLSGAHQPTGVAVRDDRLTGLYTLPYLQELLKRDWAIAQREHRSIAIFAIDVDALDSYNGTFGRAAGDSAIRRVAHCVSGCLRRSSDVTARIDGGSLMAFAPGMAVEQALTLGQVMAERVRELRIHHPRSSVLRYISVSIGVAAAVPRADDSPNGLLERSQMQLKIAKRSGRNRAA